MAKAREEVVSIEKRLIALFLVALIGGLGGGYGLAYATLQPQISLVQSGISNLNKDVAQLKISSSTSPPLGTWHTISEFEEATLSAGSTDNTPLFFVNGEKWRINWIGQEGATFDGGWTGFLIIDENGYCIDTFDLGSEYRKGTYYMHEGDGFYLIRLVGIGGMGVTFTVESFY